MKRGDEEGRKDPWLASCRTGPADRGIKDTAPDIMNGLPEDCLYDENVLN